MDGATTLAEAAELLRGFAFYLDQQAAEGWELRETIRDDYGFLEKRYVEAASPGHSE